MPAPKSAPGAARLFWRAYLPPHRQGRRVPYGVGQIKNFRDSGEKYDGRMKEKISITLSHDVLSKIDRLARENRSRSALIEHVLRSYLIERTRTAAQARDLDKINHAADRLNSEAADVWLCAEIASKSEISDTTSRPE